MVFKKIFPYSFGVRPMLEKINTNYYEKLSQPNLIVLGLTKNLKKNRNHISVVEIGVGIGATSLSICQILDQNDTYIGLDYDNKVELLVDELSREIDQGPHIIGVGNSRKTYDSYVWSILKLIESGNKVDLVFLDGAHNLIFDGLVCALVDELLIENGYLVIDDVDFTMEDLIEHNQSKQKEVEEIYTNEQIKYKQLELAINKILLKNPDFEEVSCQDPSVRIFKMRKKRND